MVINKENLLFITRIKKVGEKNSAKGMCVMGWRLRIAVEKAYETGECRHITYRSSHTRLRCVALKTHIRLPSQTVAIVNVEPSRVGLV